ncbi:MAG: DUF6088 family protein [Pseudomonas sp.]|nr:DUF6088 family protein [Pseudomonas sp.]
MSKKSNITLVNQVLSKIYGKGRGWSFSRKDFSLIAEADSIDKTLSRLATKGTIRRIARGLYDYPRYSQLLQQHLSPDMDQAAHALARKFGWTIQVTGNAALNILGISTQIPTRYLYLSDGQSRSYQILNQNLSFQKAPLTHLNLKYPQSVLLVQSLNTLGEQGYTDKHLNLMAGYLVAAGFKSVKQRRVIAKDTQYVTSWIQEVIQRVLLLAEDAEHGSYSAGTGDTTS